MNSDEFLIPIPCASAEDSLTRGLLSHRAGRALHRGNQPGLRLHPPSYESRGRAGWRGAGLGGVGTWATLGPEDMAISMGKVMRNMRNDDQPSEFIDHMNHTPISA